MPKQLRYKGRFITERNLFVKLNFAAAMKKAREKKLKEIQKNSNLEDEQPIVQLSELGKKLQCFKCKQALSLEGSQKEKILVLNSKLSVKCKNCSCVNEVMTDKVHERDKQSQASGTNSKAVLGSSHAGVGHKALNEISACPNIPQIADTSFKRNGRVVSPAIKKKLKKATKELPKKIQS